MIVDQLNACDFIHLAALLRAAETGLLGVSRFIEDRRWLQTVPGRHMCLPVCQIDGFSAE